MKPRSARNRNPDPCSNAETLVVESSTSPEAVAPGEMFTVTFSTNSGPSAVDNTLFHGIVPPEVLAFNGNTTTGGGRCGGFSFNPCNRASA